MREIKHLGDITKINGAEIEPVWCVTGGSPCQDLSVAGKRKGLSGQRSGLFMEQVRIVREMRENEKRSGRTGELCRARYLVWENVPGALSSNFKDGFGDFGAVLEEIVRVEQPEFVLPRLSGKDKWRKCGCVDLDWGQVAWRIHDAQFFGVPQRRRRIAIVCDYNGHTAADIVAELVGEACEPDRERAVLDTGAERRPEVLSFGKGLYGNHQSGEQAGEEAAGDFADGIGEHDTLADKGANQRGCVGSAYEVDCYNQSATEKKTKSLNSSAVDSDHIPCAAIEGNGQRESHKGCGYKQTDQMYTLNTTEVHGVAYGLDRASFNQGKNDLYDFSVLEEQEPTLVSKGPGAVCEPVMWGGTQVVPTLTANNAGGNQRMPDKENFNCVVEPTIYDMTHANDVIRDCGSTCPTLQNRMGTGGNNVPPTVQRIIRWIVRRLTPLECTRLQGFPDGWVDIGDWVDSKGKKHKDADSPKYKALGNSIALPFWFSMFKRMAVYLPDDATLGSLFSGIGGFDFCWELIFGKGTSRWTSEIEPFPIAVLKRRFGDEDTGEEGDMWKYP